ncbi:hypothetical protein HAX54_040127 [Datura stramonium]|uniref:AP2/ERF domain-containing protein n=1 Tax=Datura stramonium TaxID=4076 RepID=A0ABS8VRR3_DATST|nr:hypothetical protein [Datura stramonium]
MNYVNVKIRSSSQKKENPLDLYRVSGKLPPMVRKRKSGRFSTEIQNPISKKRIGLGTFDTAEEAYKVYQSKKLQLEEEVKKAKNGTVSEKSEIGSSSSSSENPPLMVVDSQTSDSSKGKAPSSGKLPTNVRLRKSGKFTTEIRDPFTKKRIWLGTFNTADAASKVYQSKKLEFQQEKLKRAKNANVEIVIPAKSELGSSSSSSSDPPLVVNSKTSDTSNKVEGKVGKENEEEMCMGHWVKVSGDKEVKVSEKLGVPVVDNYGFLQGEFSELDDLSVSI